MHEYAVTKSIVDMAVREAASAGADKIIEIKLVIGDLSSIIDESVQMYFDMIGKGTPAEGARLVFRRTPAVFYCEGCGMEFVKPSKGFDCPACGRTGKLTGAGREFYIESIEIE
ncbi:MAG: hydrogenase maturation nickel metallochaperone HypA [Clostridiales bacterium]|nr:hydrogenase maturation nickel metallochaperone HypA [Clostridiales bacterium]